MTREQEALGDAIATALVELEAQLNQIKVKFELLIETFKEQKEEQ